MVLSIDIGTTWVKIFLFEGTSSSFNILESYRYESFVSTYRGQKEDIARFLNVVRLIHNKINIIKKLYPIEYIGISGIREGLVRLSNNLNIVWVSGNNYIQKINDLEVSIKNKYINNSDYYNQNLLTLQGYLAYTLTGRMAITPSEIYGWGYTKKELIDTYFKNESFQVGCIIGKHKYYKDIYVFLGGTDEQTSCYGTGIDNNIVSISTGTYWSISKIGYVDSINPSIRNIPSSIPYPNLSIYVGYKWGKYILEQKDNENLCNIFALKIKQALVELEIESSEYTFIISGGGATYHKNLIDSIFNRLSIKYTINDIDTTMVGLFKLINNKRK